MEENNIDNKLETKMSKKSVIKFNILVIVCIIIFAFAVSPVILQNDTFYTISIGEHILNEGITPEDPFSWHEGLEYRYPHWIYDVFIYLIYNSARNGWNLFVYCVFYNDIGNSNLLYKC